jgi:hypothetical protein
MHTDVLLPSPFKWDPGTNDAHEYPDLVRRVVYFVVLPRHAFRGGASDDVCAPFEKQRYAIGKAMHVDAGSHVPSAQANGRLDNESMALEDPHVTCASSTAPVATRIYQLGVSSLPAKASTRRERLAVKKIVRAINDSVDCSSLWGDHIQPGGDLMAG